MTATCSPKQLKEWLDAGEVALIDVREPAEYKDAHIAGATLIPLGTVTADKLPEHQGKKLVMQCRSGGRSGAACAKVIQQQPSLKPINLEGGILAWIDAGFAVQKGA